MLLLLLLLLLLLVLPLLLLLLLLLVLLRILGRDMLVILLSYGRGTCREGFEVLRESRVLIVLSLSDLLRLELANWPVRVGLSP